MSPDIQISGGTFFSFLDPWNSEFTIEDIAHGLSHLCRFTGHSRVFYSVAQHSVHVSYIVPQQYAMAGLLHDAAEAFIGDVASPLKQLLPDYKAIEARVEEAVLARFGLLLPLPPEVKRADLIMLATEQRDLMPPVGRPWHIGSEIQPMAGHLVPLSPEASRKLFLERFHQIRLQREAAA